MIQIWKSGIYFVTKKCITHFISVLVNNVVYSMLTLIKYYNLFHIFRSYHVDTCEKSILSLVNIIGNVVSVEYTIDYLNVTILFPVQQ